MFYPDLSGQENVLAVGAGLFDGGTDLFLIKIALCCVDGTVADLQGIQYATLTFILCDLINAVAELWHFYAIA